ncbi:MAG: type II secretion system F family protein [Phycisphaerae bacterium]|nr:type II secretion system F family protein [Phycisphaerae bacterium]MDW8260909.1 type II secretion system F family protein [Phycisphaerales bacterium]
MDQQIVVIFLFAAAAALAGYALVSMVLSRGESNRILERMKQSAPDKQSAVKTTSARQAVSSMLSRIGTAAAQPFMPKQREQVSYLRRQFGRAGIYSSSAVALMKGAKFIGLFLGLIVGFVAGNATDNLMLWLPTAALVGYMAPTIWLKMRIKSNQKQLTLGLPDALDLMVVCVESGLTVDAAMQRVGQELVIAHPAISRELGIAHMETRVGLPRTEALKNLGIRTGNPALQSLAAMLVQADRFGTSIAQALRVHADTLRTNRQLAAEEMASKASVKMSFPLVLFIFPATFIVVMGPTIISLMKSSLMNE